MKSGLSGRDKHLRMLLRILPKRNDRRGFTLIELLVAILISGLIVSGLLYLVVEVLGINQKDAARSDTQRDMQLAMDYITRDLREAFYVYGTEVEGTSVESCLADRADAATRGANNQCTGLLAYLPDHLTPANNSNIPVLAFWKPEPLPGSVTKHCTDNKADIGKLIVVAGKANNPIDRIPCVAQRMYTLVVYSLSTENSNNTWKGRARIKRYALPHFSEDFTLSTRKPGWVPPVAADDMRPLSWPFGKDKDNKVSDLQKFPSSETIPKADKPAKVAKSEVSSDVNSETVKTVAANESPKAETTPSTSSSSIADDLTKIEGVGPKAAEEFIKAGITTFAQLATTDIDKMKEILANAESKVQHLDPTTWAEQSQLAADGKWDELKTLQDALMGGVEK